MRVAPLWIVLFACTTVESPLPNAAATQRVWSTATTTLEAERRGDGFGTAVAARDVDGDGDDDLLAGAAGGDSARLYTGGPGGAALAMTWTGLGEELGAAVAFGDLDGDGLIEAILGAPGSELVQVLERTPVGWPPAPTWTLAAPVAGRFGAALEVADFDGDGLDDLAVGAPSASDPEPNEGVVFFYRGAPGGPAVTGVRRGADVVDAFAGAYLDAADQDGDGAVDLVVSDARRMVNLNGRVTAATVYRGAPGGWPVFDRVVDFHPTATSVRAGVWFADLDEAPGLEAVRPVSYRWEGVGSTELYAYPVAFPATPWRVVAYPGLHDTLGMAMGDLTGDGVDDMLLVEGDLWGSDASVHADYEVSVRGAGAVLMREGPDFAAAAPVVLMKDLTRDVSHVILTADVNGDGVQDVVTGHPSVGQVRILDGAEVTDGWSRWPSDASWTSIPGVTIAAGDADLDGFADALLVGDGGLSLHLGGPAGLEAVAVASWPSPDPDHAWTDVGAIGDVTGDGRPDLVVGAGGSSSDVVLLSSQGAGWSELRRWTNADPSFGARIALGDLDGDGDQEVVVGAPEVPCDAVEGVVYMYAGGALPPIAPARVYGPGVCARYLGVDLAAGDVTGDGVDDLIVPGSGRVDVLQGGAAIPATYTFRLPVSGAGPVQALSRVAVGDVTGDGLSDVVLTAPTGLEGSCALFCRMDGHDAGWTRTWAGVSGGAPSARPTRRGATNNHQGGASLAVADVTGDGFADVMLGGQHAEYSDLRDLRWVSMLRGAAGGPGAAGRWSSPAGLRARGADAVRAGDVDGDGFADLLISSDLCPSLGAPCTSVLHGSASGAYADPDGDEDGDGVITRLDCDDADPGRAVPGVEIDLDGVDGDCDGVELCYLDGDLDGAFAPGVRVRSDDGDCADPGELAAPAAEDCDDLSWTVLPGALETWGDGVDGDCDGLELCAVDLDLDGAAELDWPKLELPISRDDLDLCAVPGRAGAGAPVDDCFGVAADADGDGVCDDRDTCPAVAGEDLDGDGVCAADACTGDNALGDANGDGWCDAGLQVLAASSGPSRVRVDVRGPPSRTVRLFVSEEGPGNGPCHPNFPVCLDIERPQAAPVPFVRLDAQGRGSVEWQTEPGVAREARWVQAAVPAANGRVSNVAFFRSPAE